MVYLLTRHGLDTNSITKAEPQEDQHLHCRMEWNACLQTILRSKAVGNCCSMLSQGSNDKGYSRSHSPVPQVSSSVCSWLIYILLYLALGKRRRNGCGGTESEPFVGSLGDLNRDTGLQA